MIHRSLFPLLLLALTACHAPAGGTPAVAHDTTHARGRAPLAVVDMRGGAHDLSAELAQGRPVVLVFWQTWCASCLREAPGLAAHARRLGERFRFVGVVPGTDEFVDDAEVERMAEELGLPYPQVRDRDLALSERFAVRGTPTIIVLGAEGRVLYRGHEPPADWEGLAPRT